MPQRCRYLWLVVVSLGLQSCKPSNFETPGPASLPTSQTAASKATSEVAPQESSKHERSPVAASTHVSERQVHPGDQFDVIVEVKLAPGWHIYALGKSAGINIPTTVESQLPSGVESAGSWEVPPSAVESSELDRQAATYVDKVIFQQRLKVEADATPGTKTIRCMLGYQACNQFVCRPPEEVSLECEISVVP